MSIHLATLSNIRTLNELTQLLQVMADDIYLKQSVNPQGEPVSAISVHCRHIIEFYHCFFLGLSTETINYDARQRNPEIESSRTVALKQLENLCEMLAALPTVDRPETLTLKTQVDSDLAAITTKTCVERELVSLQAHSVHHLALISIMLNHYGQSTPEEFGLANSTRIHRKKLKTT